MKKGIHPEEYRMVAFKDMSNGHTFLTRSTVETKETVEVDGAEYPLYKLEISNTSHPFYTGKVKLVDTAGRVDKFMSRYGKEKVKIFGLYERSSVCGAFFVSESVILSVIYAGRAHLGMGIKRLVQWHDYCLVEPLQIRRQNSDRLSL